MPSAPSGVTATVNVAGGVATSISVTWTNNGEGEGGAYTDGIRIYRNGVEYQVIGGATTLYDDTSFSFDVSYYYVIRGYDNGPPSVDYTSDSSNTVTPKQLLAPTIVSVIADGPGIGVAWTNNASPYTAIYVLRAVGGGGYSNIHTASYPTQYFYDWTSGQNNTCHYVIRGEISGGYGTADSGSMSATNWAVAVTDTLTLTDSVPVAGILAVVVVADTLSLADGVETAHVHGATIMDTLTMTDSVLVSKVVNVEVADTLTLTDSVLAAQTIKTAFGYYLGMSSGDVLHYDESYAQDGALSIPCRWKSKRIDYADQEPSALGRWTTLYRIRMHYEDLAANTMIAIRVSVDGGLTWMTQSAYVGTGDLQIKEKDYFFIVSGRMFNYEIVSVGACKIIALEAEYEVGGEHFEV